MWKSLTISVGDAAQLPVVRGDVPLFREVLASLARGGRFECAITGRVLGGDGCLAGVASFESSSSPGCDMLGSLIRASPQPLPLGQITPSPSQMGHIMPSPGLLSVDLPSPRPQSHSPHPSPVGSQVSSPAHHLLPRTHLNPHLSHPDLTSPRRRMSPVEYNLAALASMSGAMEGPKSSGLSGSRVNASDETDIVDPREALREESYSRRHELAAFETEKVLGDVFCNSPSRVEVTTPHRDFRWDEESENLVFAPLDEDCSTSLSMVEASPPPKVPARKRKIVDQPLVGGGEAKKGAEKKKRPRKNSSSDFVSLAASVPMPPAPQFPIPPYPLSQLTRDQVVKHARYVLKHISPAGMDIGSGNSLSWKERFPTRILSPKIKNLVGTSVETVSPSDFRCWNPGMQYARSLKSGPKANCPSWIKKFPWIPFLRLIIELFSFKFGVDPEIGLDVKRGRDAEDEREGGNRSFGRSSQAALKTAGKSSNSAFEAPVTHDVAKDPSARRDPLLRHLEGSLPVGDGPLTQVLCQWYLKCRNGELATLSELQLQGADHVLLQVSAIVSVGDETYLHLHDGKFWVPARVSSQIAEYISEGRIEVEDVVQINKSLGGPQNLSIVRLVVNNRLRALKNSILATSIVPLCDACNVTSRGEVRNKPLHRSTEVERSQIMLSPSPVRERLAGTTFSTLSIKHALIKSTLDRVGKDSYEKCLNMACSKQHVSSDFKLDNGVLVVVVQAEKNKDPAKGRTSYEVKFEPVGSGRKAPGRRLIPGWSITCDCGSFDRHPTMCKHIGAVAILYFK